MKTMIKRVLPFAVMSMVIAGFASTAKAEVNGEVQYIFNTLSFMFHGVLVFWMAAGFAMLEAGLVRSKNTTMQLLKNIALFSVAAIMYFLIGYNVMYAGVDGGYIGTFSLWGQPMAEADGPFEAGGYAAASDWFFQMVFVAATASIVSGTLAERIKLWPFLIFVVVLTGVIYPIQGAWQWGGGWLSEMGFSDFAGSTIVHSVGGWAALAGAIILGPRLGKYSADGRVNPMPGANLPLATLGTFILWMGWFGFNGGSQLALGTGADAIAISNIYINTNTAAAGGVITSMILSQIMFKKVDLTMALNGALAGLVSITAAPDTPSLLAAVAIGGVGGILVVIFIPLLDKLKIDDVVGAISVHLVAGIWGTLAVPLTNDGASFTTQLTGIISIGAFVFIASAIVWMILKVTIGIRVDEDAEHAGLDTSELAMEAYPEFGKGSQTI